ncbi:p60 domain-containing protein [Taphrina deformans PYCC 5710]|uniref:Ribosome biogenesis protein NOP53 n=1 Tax=Taphrina deformans (strain PYCC 5710 / ATCC 11124 / CBS 356.35 / IMI 108563 / JCM 9778 / NBRC 8474) TaxID=1097556 RepID=R4X7D2_TAPDE|nr:p60 domain-containing protein [Taphrina deformans PYCC 5710]|eukprot:CCG81236.1 p60 domain-containing protein [Taphrina deformans PYCC 5710]
MKGKRNHIIKPVDRQDRPEAPIRNLQRSRKGTKAWRKNIDIADVTTGLEKLREQKIQGGVIAEKPNEALFRVDVGGDKSVLKRERLGKTLRSDEILALKSAIQPVSGLAHKNSVLGDGIVHKKRKGPLPPSELLRLKKIASRVANASNGSNAAASVVPVKSTEYDVWDAPMEQEDSENWVEPVKAKRAPTTYGQAPLTLTTDGQSLPAIEVAEAGQSYNPPIEQWNDLIERKAQEQVKLDAAQKVQNTKIHAAQGVDERFEHDSQHVSDDDEEMPADASDLSTTNTNVARAMAKTQTQRNREARRQRQIEIEAAIRAKKAERRALASLGQLIDQNQDLTQSEKADLVEDVKRASVLRKHKFGKHQVPQNPLEIQLSDELAESLRTLKPEGNLFKDRFMSLVKRGIVEARVPQSKRRRYALLQKEKYSHKYEAGRPFMA